MLALVGVALAATYFAHGQRRPYELFAALANFLIVPAIYVAPLKRRVGPSAPKPWVHRLVNALSWSALAVVLLAILIDTGAL